ncbi:LysM peptidoglycan-binding domain-containing protein [Sanguibacter sp. A247]|uniref:LysM peptidoglycan-binding domain-containing protein n=1 Tax=unclassified Sanguibacter TaxID=2645534 RepID=UPI003FD7B595
MSTMSLAASPRTTRVAQVRRAAPQAENAPLRLTRRGRLVLGALVALTFLPVGLWFAGEATADAPQGAQAVTVRTVGAGESLWAIASSVTSPGDDVRVALREIARLNGLTGSQIAAGRQLVVPVVEAK